MSVKGHAGPGAPAGQPKPNPTPDDEAFRLRLVLELLGKGYHDGEIKKNVAAATGMQPRSVQRYLRLARAHLRAQLNTPIADLRAESMAFYRGILRDPNVKPHTKLNARRSLDKLLGLPVHENPNVIPSHGVDGSAEATEAVSPQEDGPKDTTQAVQQIRRIYGLSGGRVGEGGSPPPPDTKQSA